MGSPQHKIKAKDLKLKKGQKIKPRQQMCQINMQADNMIVELFSLLNLCLHTTLGDLIGSDSEGRTNLCLYRCYWISRSVMILRKLFIYPEFA